MPNCNAELLTSYLLFSIIEIPGKECIRNTEMYGN